MREGRERGGEMEGRGEWRGKASEGGGGLDGGRKAEGGRVRECCCRAAVQQPLLFACLQAHLLSSGCGDAGRAGL